MNLTDVTLRKTSYHKRVQCMILTSRHNEFKTDKQKSGFLWSCLTTRRGHEAGFWVTGKACGTGQVFKVQNTSRLYSYNLCTCQYAVLYSILKLYLQKATHSLSLLQHSKAQTHLHWPFGLSCFLPLTPLLV